MGVIPLLLVNADPWTITEGEIRRAQSARSPNYRIPF
jgi:hypothetical protein